MKQAFHLSPPQKKVVSIKGLEVATKQPETHKQITLLVTISSTGETIPPLAILKAKTISSNKSLPSHILVSGSEKGFITKKIFRAWIEKLVLLKIFSPSNPAILVLDSHKSRIDSEALATAKMHGLHILTYPAKSTHLLQPLDVSLFKPLKTNWNTLYHQKKLQQPMCLNYYLI